MLHLQKTWRIQLWKRHRKLAGLIKRAHKTEKAFIKHRLHDFQAVITSSNFNCLFWMFTPLHSTTRPSNFECAFIQWAGSICLWDGWWLTLCNLIVKTFSTSPHVLPFCQVKLGSQTSGPFNPVTIGRVGIWNRKCCFCIYMYYIYIFYVILPVFLMGSLAGRFHSAIFAAIGLKRWEVLMVPPEFLFQTFLNIDMTCKLLLYYNSPICKSIQPQSYSDYKQHGRSTFTTRRSFWLTFKADSIVTCCNFCPGLSWNQCS